MAFPVDVDATWVNPGAVSLDAGELRRADAAIFAGSGTYSGVGGGVVRHTDTSLGVTVDASDNVTVQAGSVVIPGNAVAGTGCYRSGLAAATTNALAARDATNARIDLIVFRAMDTDVVGSHGAYTGRLDKITGTPSATPSAPALPSMAVELARILVPATGGGTASVDRSYRTYATAIGGEVIVDSFARLPASAAQYTRGRTLDTGTRYEFNGSWLSIGDTAWHTIGGGGEPAFVNSWAVSGGATPQFRKDASSNLHVRGLVSGGISGTVVFTLPTGYRPSQAWTQIQTTNGATGSFGQTTVNTDGTVTVTTKGGSPTIFGLYVVCSLL